MRPHVWLCKRGAEQQAARAVSQPRSGKASSCKIENNYITVRGDLSSWCDLKQINAPTPGELVQTISSHARKNPRPGLVHCFPTGMPMWKPLLEAIRKALPKARFDDTKAFLEDTLFDSKLEGSPLIQVAVTSPRSALFSCDSLKLDVDGWAFPLPFERGIPALTIDSHAPSRAYHKLAEALAILHAPAPTSALDLGAAPGGWTRHLLMAGAEVISVDRAPLSPTVVSSTLSQRLTHVRNDATTFTPPSNRNFALLTADLSLAPAKSLTALGRLLSLPSTSFDRVVWAVKFVGTNYAEMPLLRRFIELQAHAYSLRVVHLPSQGNEVAILGCKR